MRSSYLLLFVLLINFDLHSQSYEKAPISMMDIERGIKDFEYFKAVLLERGFKFKEKDSDSEYWRVPLDKGTEVQKEIFGQILVQLSLWRNDSGQEFGRLIFFQIRKDLLPDYNRFFFYSMNTNFPEKRAKPIKVINEKTKEEKDDYELVYFRADSPITVEFEETDIWTQYRFRIGE